MSIYLIRVIIDFIQTMSSEEYPSWYSYTLFIGFCLFRLIAIVMRNYYDLHVYNYFKYVENAIKAWLFRDVQQLKLWQMQENKKAAILNILTKDIEAFVNGSWQFPYLVVVPINTLISILILYQMVRITLLLIVIVWCCDIAILSGHDWPLSPSVLFKQENCVALIHPQNAD